MRNRLTKRSVVTYTPAVQAVPARPAYCTTQEREIERPDRILSGGSPAFADNAVTLWHPVSEAYKNAHPVWSIDETLDYELIGRSHNWTHANGSWGEYRTFYLGPTFQPVKGRETVQVCYPATAGVPGKAGVATVNIQAGWNAGAKSINPFTGNASATFAFPAVPAGAVLCGLAADTAPIGAFTSIEHGLFSDGGAIKAYESGVLVYTFQALGSDKPALAIARQGQQVTYQVGSESFRSNRPSTGDKVLAAALYAGGDLVENPAFGLAAQGTLDNGALTLGGTLFGAPTGAAPIRVSGALRLGGTVYGKVTNAVVAPPVVSISSLQGVVQLTGALQGVVGRHGSIAGSIKLNMLAAQDPYAAVRGAIRLGMAARSFGAASNLVASYREFVRLDDGYHFDPVIFAVLRETLTLGVTVDLNIIVSGILFETLMLGDKPSASMLLQVLLREGITFSDNAAHARDQALQYATNLMTGGATRYENFEFLGFARAGLDAYAYKADGVYALGGASDNGETLSALVDFAAEDFNTSATKYLDTFYLGLATDGEVLLRVTDDNGRDFTYRAVGDAPTMRAPVGRGLESRLWNLRLTLTHATDAQLESVEWVAPVSTRRLTRRR